MSHQRQTPTVCDSGKLVISPPVIFAGGRHLLSRSLVPVLAGRCRQDYTLCEFREYDDFGRPEPSWRPVPTVPRPPSIGGPGLDPDPRSRHDQLARCWIASAGSASVHTINSAPGEADERFALRVRFEDATRLLRRRDPAVVALVGGFVYVARSRWVEILAARFNARMATGLTVTSRTIPTLLSNERSRLALVVLNLQVSTAGIFGWAWAWAWVWVWR